jgi:hypothetical protein
LIFDQETLNFFAKSFTHRFDIALREGEKKKRRKNKNEKATEAKTKRRKTGNQKKKQITKTIKQVKGGW